MQKSSVFRNVFDNILKTLKKINMILQRKGTNKSQ